MTVTHFIPPGGSAAGDRLATLANAPVAVSGATTAVINKHHDCTGAAAYTITLPVVSGNTSKFLSFYGGQNAGIVITIDGDGSETISGYASIVLLPGMYYELYCNGSAWFVAGAPKGLCVGAVFGAAAASLNVLGTMGVAGRNYRVMVGDLFPATDASDAYLRTEMGGAVLAGAADYLWAAQGFRSGGGGSAENVADVSDSEIELNTTGASFELGNATGEGFTAQFTIFNPAGTTLDKIMRYSTAYTSSVPESCMSNGIGKYIGATSGTPQGAITGFQIITDSGNISGFMFIFEA